MQLWVVLVAVALSLVGVAFTVFLQHTVLEDFAWGDRVPVGAAIAIINNLIWMNLVFVFIALTTGQLTVGFIAGIITAITCAVAMGKTSDIVNAIKRLPF